METFFRVPKGSDPLEPTADTRLGEAFHGYDGPLIGLLIQSGKAFLYACLAGELAQASHPRVFVYVEVDPERDWPVYADVSDLKAAVLGEFAGRPVMASLSDEIHGVLDAIEILPTEDIRSRLIKSFSVSLPQLQRELDYLPL